MKWSEEEINIIKNNFKNMSDDELTTLLPGRSSCSIKCKRKELGYLRPQFKKYSFQDVLNEFAKHDNYILLSSEDEYDDCNSKMRYICKKHKDKGEQSITLNHIYSGRGCYYCGREITAKAHIIDLDKEYDKQLCESKNFTYIDTVREKGKITIIFICNEHKELGKQHMTKYNMERSIKGCKYCCGKELPEWYVFKKAKEINPNIILLDSYTNLTTRMKCLCKKHNCKTSKTMQEILKGQGCYYCGCEKLSNSSFLSHDIAQSNISKINPHITLIEYKGATRQSKCYCNKHNRYFYKGYYALSHNKNSGCDLCYAENLRENQGMGIEEFKNRLHKVHPELLVIGEYVNNCTPIKLHCTIHDYTFFIKPVDALKRMSCCEKSRVNYKEECVCLYIENIYGFSITRQMKFDDCKDKKILPFDIYLNDYNVLIEHQGEQHYRPVRFGNETLEEANEKFEYTKKHDEIKKKYCIDNNIPLIEIPYWEFDNLEYYLFDKFVELHILEEIQ